MLTIRENQVFQFIQAFISEQGHAPSMAEIANGIGIQSRGVVHRYVKALTEKGYLCSIPQRHRNIQLIKHTFNALPLVGRIAAGQPIEAIHQEETIDVLDRLLGPKRYALKVRGNSMIEEGIFDGDIVVCERSNTAVDGQIVVVLIDRQEATLKRLKMNHNNTVTLLSANAEMKSMTFQRERIEIQGIFVGLLRFAV